MEATWEHDPDSRLDITDATTDTPVQVKIVFCCVFVLEIALLDVLCREY